MAENKPNQPAKAGRVVHPVRGGRGEPSNTGSPATPPATTGGEQPGDDQGGAEQPGRKMEQPTGGVFGNLAEEIAKQSLRWHADAAGEILNLEPHVIADLMRQVADEIGYE